MSDDKTYDLTITLDEKAMRLWANTVARQSIPVRAAARAKLAEIDAERAAAVKATERVTFRLSEIVGNSSTGIWRTTVLASDLAVGDRVEGRTVSDPMDADGYVWFNDGGTGWQYGPGSLVLLDGEGS